MTPFFWTLPNIAKWLRCFVLGHRRVRPDKLGGGPWFLCSRCNREVR